MLHSVFERSLHDQRRSLTGWTLGIVCYALLIVLMYPTIRDRPDIQKVIQSYPEALRKMFNITDLTSAAGFLNAYLFSVMVPLLIIIYAVLAGGDATAGEEDRRTIDLLLANPVSRARVIVEKSAAMAVGTALLGGAVYVTVAASGPLVGMHVPFLHMAEATVAMVLGAALFGLVAVLLGAFTGSRGLARGAAGGLAAAGYLLSSLSPMVSGLRPWRLLSPYYHAFGTDPISHGLGVVHLVVLVACIVALAAAGVRAFERRDLAV